MLLSILNSRLSAVDGAMCATFSCMFLFPSNTGLHIQTLLCMWHLIPSTTKNYVTAVAVPAAAGEGLGAAWSVEVVGSKARIDITNASGVNTAVLDVEAVLRSI